MSGRESLLAGRSEEDAEMWCDRCGRRHGVCWFAPSDLWNAVMREGKIDHADEFGFCCPSCFMELADERGIGNRGWVVVPDPGEGPYPTVSGFFARGPGMSEREGHGRQGEPGRAEAKTLPEFGPETPSRSLIAGMRTKLLGGHERLDYAARPERSEGRAS